MSYSLDIKTIIIAIAVGHLLSGILIIAYTFRKEREQSVNLFLISKLLQLTAWALIILRGQISDFLSIVLANYCLILGTTFEIIAFMSLIGCYNKTLKRLYISLVASFIFFFYFVYAFNNIESHRVMLISLYIVILWSYPISKLLSDHNASILQKIFAILYGLGLLAFLFRALAVFKFGKSMTLLSSNSFNSVSFLALYLVMLIGSIGFILLAKEKADRELLNAATFDPMTGVYNRGSFINNASTLIAFHARKELPISLLTIDLDYFKIINDTYGHQVGDIVLNDFSQNIKRHLRNYDLLGRFGGDEFIVLLPETDFSEAVEIADRLRSSVEHSIVDVGGGISYTISLGGVSVIPGQATSIETLFNLSDKALYLAKDRGRNRVEFYSEKN